MGRVTDISPAEDCVLVTPSDSETFQPCRRIEVGVSGTLKVTTDNGNDVTLPAAIVVNNWQQDLAVTKIFATGTTATDIVIYY